MSRSQRVTTGEMRRRIRPTRELAGMQAHPAARAPRAMRMARTPAYQALPPLSPRLCDVLECLLNGDSAKQVAQKLSLSPHTVHQYIKDLYKRFGVASRGELLARFIRRRV